MDKEAIKPIRRVVTGNDAQGRSYVLYDSAAPNVNANTFNKGTGMTDIWVVLIKIVLALVWFFVLTLYLTWAERKESAVIQDRVGANRARILGMTVIGLFQPIADAIKMFFKEDFVPAFSRKARSITEGKRFRRCFRT